MYNIQNFWKSINSKIPNMIRTHDLKICSEPSNLLRYALDDNFGKILLKWYLILLFNYFD